MFPLARFRVADESMRPGLAPGDYVLVNRWAYRRRGPAVGDVVVIRDPEAHDRFLVKRISILAEDGSLQVLGDNRQRSRDSRHFGPVRQSAIVGRIWLHAKP